MWRIVEIRVQHGYTVPALYLHENPIFSPLRPKTRVFGEARQEHATSISLTLWHISPHHSNKQTFCWVCEIKVCVAHGSALGAGFFIFYYYIRYVFFIPYILYWS